MKRIIRNLFGEREKQEKGLTKEYFSLDMLIKILRLMESYSFDIPIPVEVRTIPNFLDRLSFQIPEGNIRNGYNLSQLINYLEKSNLNDCLSLIELFVMTLFEECSKLQGQYYYNFKNFIIELNNLFAGKKIPFQLRFNDKLSKVYFERIDSPLEEVNKNKVYELINKSEFSEVNEYFTGCLINLTKKGYLDCIEQAYLTLEKYLKIKVNNHKIDAPKAFAEFKKKFNVKRGIFEIHRDKIKNKINLIYSIRRKIKSHSSEELFDRKDFLEETARFQLNEVMNLIILLNSFKEK